MCLLIQFSKVLNFNSNFQNYYDKGDAGMDVENLGNGSLVTFMIISPVLLICYVLDGRFAIQSLFLEWVSHGFDSRANCSNGGCIESR